jgi:hypothetical protein
LEVELSDSDIFTFSTNTPIPECDVNAIILNKINANLTSVANSVKSIQAAKSPHHSTKKANANSGGTHHWKSQDDRNNPPRPYWKADDESRFDDNNY